MNQRDNRPPHTQTYCVWHETITLRSGYSPWIDNRQNTLVEQSNKFFANCFLKMFYLWHRFKIRANTHTHVKEFPVASCNSGRRFQSFFRLLDIWVRELENVTFIGSDLSENRFSLSWTTLHYVYYFTVWIAHLKIFLRHTLFAWREILQTRVYWLCNLFFTWSNVK